MENQELKIIYLKTKESFNRKPEVTVVTENIGNQLNLKRCSLYLQLWYEDYVSQENILRCYNIFKLVAKKGTSCESMEDEDDNMDFYRESYWEKSGTFFISRKDYIYLLFRNVNLRFVCYDIDTEVDGSKRRKFTLRELLTNEEKYRYFYEYWNNLPDYETIRYLLLEVLPNKDVVDMIGVLY